MESLVEEAVARTGGKFTAEEIGRYINAASAYVQKPLFMLLGEMLAAHSSPACTRHKRELDAIGGNMQSMALRIDGDALHADLHSMLGNGAALDIWLAIGPSDHVNNLPVPDDAEFNAAIYANYDMLRKTAIAYWERFKLEYKTVYDGLVEVFGADTMGSLKNPADSLMTLCWDPAFGRRAVIMSAYRNARGFLQLRKK